MRPGLELSSWAVVVSLLLTQTAAHQYLTNSRVHAFYYLWYGNPATDGQWRHWNHAVLPHWTAHVRERYPANVSFVPPHDIHAPFYPARGLYSSANESLLLEHFMDMRVHGVGVAVISWWGRPGTSSGDTQGVVTESLLPAVMRAAQTAGIHIAFHMEPYHGRTAESFRLDVQYLRKVYGNEACVYKLPPRRQVPASNQASPNEHPAELMPVFYVYDSYHIASSEWSKLMSPGGTHSVRGTPADGVFIGLWLNREHGQELADSGFDGSYTYFASQGSSYGSTTSNWKSMARFSQEHNMLFAPSVGPGYDDTRIRPWNVGNRRDREGGRYYARMWEDALAADALYIGLSTYNEWGEGTQLEAALPRLIPVSELEESRKALSRELRVKLGLRDAYECYSPHEPDFYMMETLKYSARLAQQAGLTLVADALHDLMGVHDRLRREAVRASHALIQSLPDHEDSEAAVGETMTPTPLNAQSIVSYAVDSNCGTAHAPYEALSSFSFEATVDADGTHHGSHRTAPTLNHSTHTVP